MTEKQESQPEAPKDHPAPKDWWKTIEVQSWIGHIALVIEVPALLIFGVDEHGVWPLVIVNCSLLGSVITYSGGTWAIDALRAWRGTGDAGSSG